MKVGFAPQNSTICPSSLLPFLVLFTFFWGYVSVCALVTYKSLKQSYMNAVVQNYHKFPPFEVMPPMWFLCFSYVSLMVTYMLESVNTENIERHERGR